MKLKNILNQSSFFLIAGPCVIESKALIDEVCETMKKITLKLGIPYIFKASFDKANRSSIKGYRGPSLKEGLLMLKNLKEKYDVPILSDIHTPEMIEEAGKVLDMIQIPAFLARQTDLYIEAAKTKKILNIKKGQFMSPYEIENASKKFLEAGGKELLVTERGSFFGYGNLVVDFRSIKVIKDMGIPYVYDATHSLQLPAAKGSHSGGQREFLPSLAKAQLAAGADGLFIETHPFPSQAKSDQETQYPLNKMELLLKELLEVYQIRKKQTLF